MGYYHHFKTKYFEPFPFPECKTNEKEAIVELVNKAIEIKKQKPNEDTSELEAVIDQLVYGLYGLTEEEIKIVENSYGKK